MEQVCRLCLNVFDFKDIHIKQINIREVNKLRFLLLDLDMAITKNPVICFNCCDTLQKSYNFKKFLKQTDTYLNQHYGMERKEKLILNHMSTNNSSKNYDEDLGACRFCLSYLRIHSIVKLDKLEEDVFLDNMISKCLPEFDMEIVDEPAMCVDCMGKLQTFYNFVMVCQDSDEKIRNYILAEGEGVKGPVSLTDVLRFVAGTDEDTECSKREPEVKIEVVEEEIEISDGVVADDTENETVNMFEGMEEDTSLNGGGRIPSKRKTVGKSGKKDVGKTSKKVDQAKPKTDEPKEHTCTFCIPAPKARFHQPHNTPADHRNTFHNKIRRSKKLARIYQCRNCDFAARDKLLWIEHCKDHRDASLTQCDRCLRGFDRPASLDGHILSSHPDLERLIRGKVFRCEKCGYKTVNRSYLPRHSCPKELLRCDRCDFATALRYRLVTHKRRMHVGLGWMWENRMSPAWRKEEVDQPMEEEEEEEEYERLVGEIDEIMKRRSALA